MVSPEKIGIYPINHTSDIEGIVSKKRYAGDIIYYSVDIKNNTLKVSSLNNKYNIGDKVKVDIDFENSIYFNL